MIISLDGGLAAQQRILQHCFNHSQLIVRMGFDLIAYWLVLGGISLATSRFAPSLATLAFITGLSACGGGLFWGVLAVRGRHHKKGAVAMLAVVSCLSLSLCISAWRSDLENTKIQLAAAATSLMLFFYIGQTVLLVREEDKGLQK